MVASWVGRVAGLTCFAGLLLVAFAFASGRATAVRVCGGSMAPALWPGDVCLVTPVERPAVSDIVLLAEPGHATRVLHRVRSVEHTSVITQGDANPIPDRDPVPRRALLGKVSRVLPVGRLFRWWQCASGR